MTGVKGRSGRRKPLGTQIFEALGVIDLALPNIIRKLIEKATYETKHICPHCAKTIIIPGGGDRDALIYLIDRRMGKPRQSTDIELKGSGEIATSVVIELLKTISKRQLEDNETKLIGTSELIPGNGETEEPKE